MSRLAPHVQITTRLLTVALVGALSLVGLGGCGDSGGTESGTAGDTTSGETTDVPEPSEPGDSTKSGQGSTVNESQLLGKWSPNLDDAQPTYIDFFYREGRLYYYYYIEVLGNGSGIGLANGTSEFEIDQGFVAFQADQPQCSCMRFFKEGVSCIDFDLSSLADGVIYDLDDGEAFVYVGASTEDEHTLYELERAANSGQTSGTTTDTGASAATIDTPEMAIEYVTTCLQNAGKEVPPSIEYEGMSDGCYLLHGFEFVQDGSEGGHTATWFWYQVAPDGTIYDYVLGGEVNPTTME